MKIGRLFPDLLASLGGDEVPAEAPSESASTEEASAGDEGEMDPELAALLKSLE